MNKLFGLYYIPAPGDDPASFARFVSASNKIDKLTQSVPNVNSWTVSNDPNTPNLRRYSELADNSKYIIYEIPYIC